MPSSKQNFILQWVLLFLLFPVTKNIIAQQIDFGPLMTERYLTCQDIELNATMLLPSYYENSKMDTVTALLNYWQDRCGTVESLFRGQVLIAIDQDTFNMDSLPEAFAYHVLRFEGIKHYLNNNDYYNLPMDLAYWNFTKRMAIRLRNRGNLTAEERFFTTLYSGNVKEAYNILHNDTALAGSRLATLKEFEASSPDTTRQTNTSWLAGAWIPEGNLSIVGVHPKLGFRIGTRGKTLAWNFEVSFKFLKARNEYLVRKDDSIYTSQHFFGGFIGGDVSYGLLERKRHILDIAAGIGFEGFDVLDIEVDDNPANDISESIGTLNLNVGLVYRIRLNERGTTLGIRARYNYQNYNNAGGTDLSGNVWSVSILVGRLFRSRSYGSPGYYPYYHSW